MAHIDKKNGKYRVRWTALDGSGRSRTCPDRRTADALKRLVEQERALGRDWTPDEAPAGAPKLIDVADEYLSAMGHKLAAGTLRTRTYQLDVFFRFLEDHREGEPTADWLSRVLLLDYVAWLRAGTGRHGAPRDAGTARRYVGVVELLWSWAHDWKDEHDWTGIPAPKRVSADVRSPAQQWRAAPTWAEMAACVNAASGWQRSLLTVLYYTGLRVQQALDLLRTDLDLDRAVLTIRPDLGKTKAEQTGRAVPVSEHFVAWVRAEPLVDGGWLVPCDRKVRLPRDRDVVRAWERTTARREVWDGRPHHAFRAGWMTGLRQGGAELDAVEFLVGHAPTMTALSYFDPEAFALRDAVKRIPCLVQQ